MSVAVGVGGCGWWWEGSLVWFARWLWLAAAGGGRLAEGEAWGVSALLARRGERRWRLWRRVSGWVDGC